MFSRLVLSRICYRSTKPTTLWQPPAGSSRYLSSISHHDETVSIPIGGSGTVNLTISRPTQPANNNNVLVYLPSGPLLPSSSSNTSSITSKTLKNAFPTTTIVDIRYRISLQDVPTSTALQCGSSKAKREENKETKPDYRFPTPIHDVFTAWDYITDNLELYNHDIVDGKKIYHRPQTCVLGSHIGGALALSLALTNPDSIVAVALLDGIVDWVGLDEVAGAEEDDTSEQKERSRRNHNAKRERDIQRLAARELIRLRRRLFRSHSGYFDAFASPVLFLRAPGRDTPVEPMGDVQGHLMRYGDGVGEVAVVKSDGAGTGEAFGPYDDDWQAHVPGEEVHNTDSKSELVQGRANRDGKGARLSIDSGTNQDSETLSTTSTSAEKESTRTSTTPPSSPESPPTPPRRRKVLRRWPPTAHPEDILLPYINIFTTTSPSPPPSHTQNDRNPQEIDISPILNLQAIEFQELLRKACFWGREKSFAEERVTLTKFAEKGSENETKSERNGDAEEMFDWLRGRFSA